MAINFPLKDFPSAHRWFKTRFLPFYLSLSCGMSCPLLFFIIIIFFTSVFVFCVCDENCCSSFEERGGGGGQ
jgi:hypothetical protein